MAFHEMGLDDRILKSIAKLGWSVPTLIQVTDIEILNSGQAETFKLRNLLNIKIFLENLYRKVSDHLESKFWRSGVPTRDSSSRRILKLCNLGRVEAKS